MAGFVASEGVSRFAVDLVSPFYAPVTGGIEDHVAALAARVRAAGHGVVVHTLAQDAMRRPLAAQAEIDGVRVQRWPATRRIGYYTTRFEPELEGDILHLHAYGLWTHDWVAREYPYRPKLLTLHHGFKVPTKNPVNRAYHWWHRRRAGWRTLEAMDALVAVTPLDVSRLEAAGIEGKKIHLIPNGVPSSAFAEAEAAEPPTGVSRYLLYLGRLHREKDVETAIHALARLPDSVGLVVAGPDHGRRPALEALVAQLGVGARVVFEGRVSQERKRALLAGCLALVLPSRYEAQGRVILEAWAQSRPVVATRVGGVPYVVEDGRDGLLVPWGRPDAMAKAVLRLMEDVSAADAMGAQGLDKARREYQEEVLMDRVVALYESLV
jgi:glycosyltransferase involved in cell wall biosynthesis